MSKPSDEDNILHAINDPQTSKNYEIKPLLNRIQSVDIAFPSPDVFIERRSCFKRTFGKMEPGYQ